MGLLHKNRMPNEQQCTYLALDPLSIHGSQKCNAMFTRNGLRVIIVDSYIQCMIAINFNMVLTSRHGLQCDNDKISMEFISKI